MKQTSEIVDVGSTEPTKDGEGMSALPAGDLRVDPLSVVCVDKLSQTLVFGRSNDTLIHV